MFCYRVTTFVTIVNIIILRTAVHAAKSSLFSFFKIQLSVRQNRDVICMESDETPVFIWCHVTLVTVVSDTKR